MLQTELGQDGAFLVRDQELFGEVGKDADAVDAHVDGAVQNALHAFQIQRAIVVERGGNNGPAAGVSGHG